MFLCASDGEKYDFSKKIALKNDTLFFWKNTFFIKSVDFDRTSPRELYGVTDLEKLMRKDQVSSDFDCRTSELWKMKSKKSKFWTYIFPTLHFIWFLLIFQFFAYALPIGIWQVLMNPKNTNLDQPYSTGASTELYLSILRKNHIPDFWAAVE